MAEPLVFARILVWRFQTGGGFLSRPRSVLTVRDVLLTAARSEVFGIVCESGCGKSNLTRLIFRQIEPTIGQGLVDGADLGALGKREMRQIRTRITVVLQYPYSPLDPRHAGDRIDRINPAGLGFAKVDDNLAIQVAQVRRPDEEPCCSRFMAALRDLDAQGLSELVDIPAAAFPFTPKEAQSMREARPVAALLLRAFAAIGGEYLATQQFGVARFASTPRSAKIASRFR